MEQTIKCCESLSKIRRYFEWFKYEDEGSPVYCMPSFSGNNGVKYRVNFCPVCGKDIRDIKLINK